jgi:hypothetical protein
VLGWEEARVFLCFFLTLEVISTIESNTEATVQKHWSYRLPCLILLGSKSSSIWIDSTTDLVLYYYGLLRSIFCHSDASNSSRECDELSFAHLIQFWYVL